MKFILDLKHWQLFLLFTIMGVVEFFLTGNLEFTGLCFPLLWAFLIIFYGKQKLAQLGFKQYSLSLLISIFVFIVIVLIAVGLYSIFPDSFSHLLDYFLPLLALIAIAAAFWTIFLAAKIITKIENRKEVKFNDYFDNFLFIAIPILGIWILSLE